MHYLLKTMTNAHTPPHEVGAFDSVDSALNYLTAKGYDLLEREEDSKGFHDIAAAMHGDIQLFTLEPQEA